MLTDEAMDDLRWKSELIGGVVPIRPEELRDLLAEIARLRAENDQLRAALAAKTLQKETVAFIRHEMFLQWNHPEDADEEVDAVVADIDRCYPPEEV